MPAARRRDRAAMKSPGALGLRRGTLRDYAGSHRTRSGHSWGAEDLRIPSRPWARVRHFVVRRVKTLYAPVGPDGLAALNKRDREIGDGSRARRLQVLFMKDMRQRTCPAVGSRRQPRQPGTHRFWPAGAGQLGGTPMETARAGPQRELGPRTARDRTARRHVALDHLAGDGIGACRGRRDTECREHLHQVDLRIPGHDGLRGRRRRQRHIRRRNPQPRGYCYRPRDRRHVSLRRLEAHVHGARPCRADRLHRWLQGGDHGRGDGGLAPGQPGSGGVHADRVHPGGQRKRFQGTLDILRGHRG